jgi:DNA-binding CsgD family transcriptional regulator/tetratricopeptide (TPR) repeat protein
MAGPVAFVGRESELSHLLRVLAGDIRMVLVVGDAGVGKTRFAGEGMARAAAAGMVTVRGECLPLAGMLPLLPVVQALRELGEPEGGRLLEEGLAAAPVYAREEVRRLLPWLGPGEGTGAGGPGEGWRRERLFSAVADLLDAVAGRAAAGVGLVVEDVHWADSATLDLLTFLARPGCGDAVTVVATCRGDEAPLAAQVTGWLAQVRGAAGVAEIGLGPLSRVEVAQQVAALAGGPVPPPVVDELFARAGGNAFFTEQLVAAALADAAGGELRVPAGLPARLTGLLAVRAGRCTGDAQVVLAALAVAGRPLSEGQLSGVSGLDAEAVRRGLRQLAEARLLAEGTADGGHRPRHALLAEAVGTGLLPGERAMLHERTARTLAAGGDHELAADVAGHWRAADRPAEELPARIAAAKAAERVFGYTEAAAHWERAIELCQVQTAGDTAGAGLPRLYLRAIGAAERSGDTQHASVLAEEAYERFAGHPDPATAAVICYRAGYLRGLHDPDAGLPLMERALELFELGPPSPEHAEALLHYAQTFLLLAYGRRDDHVAALTRALEIAEAADANGVIPRILVRIPVDAQEPGAVEKVSAKFDRARAAAEAAGDDAALVEVAMVESDTYLQMADFASAEDVALRGLHAARRAGLDSWFPAAILVSNAAEAILFAGRTADAAALIDPLTTGPPRGDDRFTHLLRAQLDMLRGDLAAATGRQQQVALTSPPSDVENDREAAQLTVEVALWAGRPGDALQQVRQALAPYGVPELTGGCGQLLAAGLRACADLAEQARARRDHDAARAAESAAAELGSLAEQMAGVPFTDSPFLAQIPANHATWRAEWTRLAGASDPGAWHTAAKSWETLNYPHRAGYAWWRHAQAQLDAGQPTTAATAALQAAATASAGHAPLHAQVDALAARAHIPLDVPATTTTAPPPAPVSAPYGLTVRELAVLRLLAAGRTNNQIGTELYISPTTARVHVSNILRKLGVTSRVQAAALAERAGLLGPGQR